MTKVNNVTCYAYFGGRDGMGTCDDECQWYAVPCPWWIPEEYWNEEMYRDYVNAKIGK